MSRAIFNYIRSVGLKNLPRADDLISSIIPRQSFVSDDNRLSLTAMYIGDKNLANEIIADYIKMMDEFNNQGALKLKYSLMEEICDIEEKEWAQKLEDWLPYEQRSAEVFSVFESPLAHRGIRGKACNISLATHDGYFVSVTAFDTQDEVKEEDVEYFISGQAFQDLVAMKKN